MRWNHPEKGPISPGIFIPSAEETGLINEASQWALQEACAALKRIQNKVKAEHDLFMSVNFSSSDFNIDGFADTLLAVITKQGLKRAAAW